MIDESLVARLAAFRTLAAIPRAQLEWLVERGSVIHLNAGETYVAKGAPVQYLAVVLSGHLSIYVDRGAGPHKVMESRDGDVTGYLPYSRLVVTPADVKAEEPTELLVVSRELIPDLIRDCYDITALCVHTMLDRARQFTSSDLQEDKMSSLGKLAAGLAHELNNPASAVARSAEGLSDKLGEVDRTSRALGSLRLSSEQQAVVSRIRTMCQASVNATAGRTAMERADREDALADWLATHGLSVSASEALAESAVTLEALNEVATVLDREQLQVTVDWLVAGCATSQLASEIEIAASRIHKLVGAVKGFTYMDQATLPKPVDLRLGLSDTLAVLNGKARSRNITVHLDVGGALPQVQGFGGELNQVWLNLIDNALDAAESEVEVTAKAHATTVSISVADNGGGIATDLIERVFDPFFTTKPVGQGTGLGLDIARRIIRKHRGDITVASRPGRTAFCVTLPVGAGPL